METMKFFAKHEGSDIWAEFEGSCTADAVIKYVSERPAPFGSDKNRVVWNTVLIIDAGGVTKWSVGCEWIPDYTAFKDEEG